MENIKTKLITPQDTSTLGKFEKVAKVHRTPTKVLSEQIFTKLIPSGEIFREIFNSDIFWSLKVDKKKHHGDVYGFVNKIM